MWRDLGFDNTCSKDVLIVPIGSGFLVNGRLASDLESL